MLRPFSPRFAAGTDAFFFFFFFSLPEERNSEGESLGKGEGMEKAALAIKVAKEARAPPTVSLPFFFTLAVH